MPNSTDSSLDIIQALLESSRPIVDGLSTLVWKASDGFWLLLCRCVLRRQFDSLEAIANLTRRREGHCSVPLLRPACEEFLWIKYLHTLSGDVREEILLHKSQLETVDSVEAQRAHAGDKVMEEVGFTPKYMGRLRENRTRAQNRLKTIKQELKWPKKPEFLPSVSFIASTTGERELYELIYHATSRTVHFTVSELLRRAWGDAREVNITSQRMGKYWSEFSLYWGWRIFFFTLVEIADALQDEGVSAPNFTDEFLFETLMKKFSEFGMVPIITAEELNLHIPDDKRHLFINPT
jgi:hypothetical protein